jgi:hypothetical protein
MELALRRLPYLLETDPELAWKAAPFISDTQEAFRLVAAYRTGSLTQLRWENFRPDPASIAVALNLGVIDDTLAVEELFSPDPQSGAVSTNVLDRDNILSVGRLLRGEKGRNLFFQKLLSFTGIITADDDKDGFPESRAVYLNGVLQEYSLDADQDRREEMFISFSGGAPQWTRTMLLPEQNTYENPVLILWERYPSVLRAELDGAVYIPRPGEFQFEPVRLAELSGGIDFPGLLYPQPESRQSGLSRRTLVYYSLQIQRPSAEFKDAVEWIDIDRGIPWRAVEMLNGRMVSITEYEQGRPVLQRVDLDGDSRMETLRRFRRMDHSAEDALFFQKIPERSESDWNGDGLYEYSEEYLLDGSVVYSWDMDGSGIRDYSEIRK